MNPIIEGWNIVLVGKWNPYIFSPAWVGQNLFDKPVEDEMQVEIQVMPVPKYRLVDDGVYLDTNDDRIHISFKAYNENYFAKGFKIAEKILNLLPHTPVMGVGINLRYSTDLEAEYLNEIFNNDLDIKFASNGFLVASSAITKSIKKDDTVLNIIISKTNAGFIFDFNFHYEISNKEIIFDNLKPGFSPKEAMCSEILSDIFEVEGKEV